MEITGIIPARFGSTRFLGKPLADIAGVSMIRRVYERATLANITRVVVATDDARIAEHVQVFGEVVMTKKEHRTGTDRCSEVAKRLNLSGIVVNIQGDEPLVSPHQIEAVANYLVNNPVTDIATVTFPRLDTHDLGNKNVVKAFVRLADYQALDFSRSRWPEGRVLADVPYLVQKHVGMYAFRAAILPILSALPSSPLELAESLEQLRWLENGFQIGIVETDTETIGVDTPEDIAKIIALINKYRV